MARESPDSRVVVTGLGVVAPGAFGASEFRARLLEGRSAISRVTLFNASRHECQVAGEVAGLEERHPLPEPERRKTARVVPLALLAAREALASARLYPEDMSDEERCRTGVILGTGAGGIDFTEAQYESYFTRGARRTSPYAIVASFAGMVASELSIFFRLRGLSHVVSTGCTSATDAMGYALSFLRAGRLARVLTGGVDACITPAVLASFARMGTVATRWNDEPARASRPFSRDRDGFVLAEGAWLFVFETLAHAEAREAPILAEVAGYGSTSDAYHRVQIEPSGEEPARAMLLALSDARASAAEVDHVSLHGTATERNDLAETRAIRLALGERAREVPLSAPKSIFGHPQGASGALGAAAAIVAMESGLVPPTINLDVPDPDCDLDYTAHRARRHRVDLAVANCIAFGAKNSALVLRRLRD